MSEAAITISLTPAALGYLVGATFIVSVAITIMYVVKRSTGP